MSHEGISITNSSYELELLRRERLLLQREVDLMRQENERLKLNSPSVSEGERPKQPSMNIKIISELLGEFSGVNQDFRK